MNCTCKQNNDHINGIFVNLKWMSSCISCGFLNACEIGPNFQAKMRRVRLSLFFGKFAWQSIFTLVAQIFFSAKTSINILRSINSYQINIGPIHADRLFGPIHTDRLFRPIHTDGLFWPCFQLSKNGTFWRKSFMCRKKKLFSLVCEFRLV